jgi:hypothetical protein
MASTRRRFVLSTLVLMLSAHVALSGDPAIERVIGPVQGRSGPPYIEATAKVEIGVFERNQWDRLQEGLDALATKSDMNARVLKMSVSSKMCQLTKTSKPSMKAIAQLFKESPIVAITVKKNGSIEMKGATAPAKGNKK